MIRKDIEALVAAINEAVAGGYKIKPGDKRFVVWATFQVSLSKKDGDRLQGIYRVAVGGGIYERRQRI